MTKKIITLGLDNGNGTTKIIDKDGNNFIFPSGYREYEKEPALYDMEYEGKYYTFDTRTSGSIAKKTETEDMWVQSVYAIAKILEQLRKKDMSTCTYEINLAVGTPIMAYKHKSNYQKYFLDRGQITAKLNNVTYTFCVVDTKVYIQGVCIYLLHKKDIGQSDNIKLLDIGTKTTDLVVTDSQGKPINSECISKDFGMLQIIKKVSQALFENEYKMSYEDIGMAIMRDSINHKNSAEIMKIINNTVNECVEDFIDDLGETMDIGVPVVLAGGGGQALKRFFVGTVMQVVATYGILENAKAFYTCYTGKIVKKKE